VDVDDLPDVSDWAEISDVPTFIAYKENKKLGVIVGADLDIKNVEKILSFLNNLKK
jgi:hypothetical protein